MDTETDAAYGARLWDIVRADLRDRLRGDGARANARWGLLRPPAGRGRLIWVKAGGGRHSVRLAAEVLQAIRERRLDVRLVLTFERDYRDILTATLKATRKVGIGYGPCDRPAAVAHVLASFAPTGVIIVGHRPPPNLARALATADVHALAVHTPPAAGRFEAVYPASAGQAEGWRGRAAYLAPPADFLTLLVAAQVEPNFKAYLSGSATLDLWWLHGLEPMEVGDAVRQWQRSPLSRSGLLFLGPAREGDTGRLLAAAGTVRTLALERWDRAPVAPGTVVMIDHERWLPAVAAAASGIHFQRAGAWAFWQGLAGGQPVTLAPGIRSADFMTPADPRAAARLLPVAAGLDAVWAQWVRDAADPIPARQRGDAVRRLFWDERRRAQQVSQELLERVFAW